MSEESVKLVITENAALQQQNNEILSPVKIPRLTSKLRNELIMEFGKLYPDPIKDDEKREEMIDNWIITETKNKGLHIKHSKIIDPKNKLIQKIENLKRKIESLNQELCLLK
jgi:hypothetical protein